MSVEKFSYELLGRLQTVCLKQNIPFVSFRLPLQSDIITFVQYKSFPEKLGSLDGIDRESGFIMAPFIESEEHGIFLLKPDFVFKNDDIDAELIENQKDNYRFIDITRSTAQEKSTTPATCYMHQVTDAVEAIKEGSLHKVVLSKIRLEKRNDDFDPAFFFQRLCSKYPYAFIYMIQLPQAGCWMGATPEPLLVFEDETVKTVSLAGTQVATDVPVATYTWSEKELEEQGIVTGFVEQALHSLGIENYIKTGPSNYQAANLIHLKTAFEFPRCQLNNRVGDFLRALHPTPSVGGLPKTAARNFILANETHDRSYYTGFLGPLNIKNETNIFVNLRCLQLFERQVVLYSGAGITASSNAEDEWKETDNKMLTMLNVMKSASTFGD